MPNYPDTLSISSSAAPAGAQTQVADVADSSSLYYFFRQEPAYDLQWLTSLSSAAPAPNLLQQRRAALVGQSYSEQPKTESLPSSPPSLLADTLLNDTVADAPAQSPTTKPVLDLHQRPSLVQERDNDAPFWNPHWQLSLQSTDFVLLLAIVGFLFLTWVRSQFPQQMRRLGLSILRYADQYKAYRENNLMARRFYAAMSVVYYLVLSLFLFEFAQFLGLHWWTDNYFLQYLVLLAAVILAYVAKRIMLATVGQVFMSFRLAEEYWFSLRTINLALAIGLLPFVVFLPYVPENWRPYTYYAAWTLVGLSFLLRLLRGLRIAFEKHLSVFYMFLYFCTLEILPIVLVTKGVTMWISML